MTDSGNSVTRQFVPQTVPQDCRTGCRAELAVRCLPEPSGVDHDHTVTTSLEAGSWRQTFTHDHAKKYGSRVPC